MGLSSQACSRSRRWRCPFPQNGCSTRNVQNTVLHHCCCFPEEYLIPSHSCPSTCTGWMQLWMARTDTVTLSVWESISWSTGPFLKQAIYQINSPWNILALRSETITSINNKVFPKSAGDHKEKTVRISIWQNTLLFGFFSPPPSLGNPSLPWKKMQIALQEHTNFASKSSDIRLWMLLNLRKCEVQVLHNKCYCSTYRALTADMTTIAFA